MINSFWNICSTCPMSKEEKLNSEYKRNYVWHPNYPAVPQEVIRNAPQTVSKPKEVVIQRRKQYPDLAYRTNKVIGQDAGYGVDTMTIRESIDLRARSEERAVTVPKSGPRSRSADPNMGRQHHKLVMVQSYPPLHSGRTAVLTKNEGLPKTTEYQSQFAWPKKSKEDVCCTARKSVSMGLIKSTEPLVPPAGKVKVDVAPLHPVRPCAVEKEITATVDKSAPDAKRRIKTEYKSKYKPFTSYVYVDGQWKKTSRLVKVPEKSGPDLDPNPWYTEVMERLKKANEYRWRGQGNPVYGQQLPQIYGQQGEDMTVKIRTKGESPEVHVRLPRVPSHGKAEGKKKEKTDKRDMSVDWKRERDKGVAGKTAAVWCRPKSAEPLKLKEEIIPKQHKQRPATTPPARDQPPAGHSKKSTKKTEEERRPKSARSLVSRRQTEDSPRSTTGKNKTKRISSAGTSGKVWLRAGEPVHQHRAVDESAEQDVVRPSTLLPSVEQGIQQHNGTNIEASASGELSAAPVPLTTVKTPEEVTGVKSPDPEFWTVPLDSGQRLQWSDGSSSESPVMQPKLQSLPAVTNVHKEDQLHPIKAPASAEIVPSTRAPVPQEVPPVVPGATKMATADVLDRARSRLDQFWGKNK